MKKYISCVILTALCIFGGIAVHAEENETEMTDGFVPVTLGGSGNTEYSDPVSPDTEQTQSGSTDKTPDTPESTPDPPALVKPIVTPDAPEPVRTEPTPSEQSEQTKPNTVKPNPAKPGQTKPEPVKPVKTDPQTATTTPARPLTSETQTYTDETDMGDDTSYYYENDEYPDYSYSHRRNEPPAPSVSLTPSIRGTSQKNDLNITARTDANGNITLTWDKVRKADKYTVYLLNGKKYTKMGETRKTTYTYRGAKNGNTYQFVVRYTTGGETSSISDSFKISVTVRNVSSKPVVTAAVKGENVTLRWDVVPDAKEYAVYRISDSKLEKIITTKKTGAVIQQKPTDTGYAVKAYVKGKWTAVNNNDIATVKA